MHSCSECSQFGLRFERGYEPHEFIEGNRQARIWVVGLNPAQDPEWRDDREKEQLLSYFDDRAKVHGYFKQFKVVSERLYNLFGAEAGVAHTDLVKCSSMSWPPEGVSSSGRGEIIARCSRYLQKQLEENQPELIICNGSEVSSEIRRLLPPTEPESMNATSYVHESNGRRITVVLSGFIGRIDNYAKRRLGMEIESLTELL